MNHTDVDETITRYFPPELFGAICAATPIKIGLSGARVFAVETDVGKHVLRIPATGEDTAHYLPLLQLASDNQIAPKIEHIDAKTGATVSTAIYGEPFGRVFANPATRPAAIKSIISALRALHELPITNASVADPIGLARAAWKEQSVRPGFPEWALGLENVINDAEKGLAHDPRLVLSHNDVNPANILWDGERAWLVDWYVAAQNHPYYDLAALCTFFELPLEVGVSLLELQEQASLNSSDHHLFQLLRKLVAVFCASTVLKLIPDLSAMHSYSLRDAPTLMQAYQTLAGGSITPQSPEFQHMMSIALLRQAVLF